jgi:uncharacterized protein
LSVYLDTSVLVPLFIREDVSHLVENWINSVREKLYCSHLVAGEFNSAVSRYVRMGALNSDQADAIRDNAAHWLQRGVINAAIDDEDVQRASRAVANPSPKLLMPDAIHLVVCARMNLTLATLDQDLLIIATREGVAAISPA